VALGETRTRYEYTYIILAIGTTAFSLLQSLVSPILPLLATTLHTSQTTVTWALTAYLLSSAVLTPILGRLGDAFGKREVLALVLALIAAGSILAAVANSIGVLIAARAIQGAGGGAIPLAFAIVRDEFPRQRVASAVSLIAALLAVGGGIGLAVAGPVVNLIGYRWLFVIPGLIVGMAAIATLLVVPESPVRTNSKISWTAACVLSGWLVALLLAVSQAPDWGWRSKPVVGLLAAAVVLAAIWAKLERRSDQPLIDLRLVAAPSMRTMNVVALLFGVSLYAVYGFMPSFLQAPKGAGYGFAASITESGLIALPASVASFAGGALSAPLSRRFGAKAVVVTGLLGGGPAFLFLAVAHSQIWEVSVALIVQGAAGGLVFAGMANMVLDAVPPHQSGVANGVNTNIRTIGGAIGTAILASVLAAGLRSHGLPRESGYTAVFVILACSRFLAGLVALGIPGAPRGNAHEEVEAVVVVQPHQPPLDP
jgi:MFS family permease